MAGKIDDWSLRVRLAKQWREKLPAHQKLAESCFYIRIGGSRFRPISISDENPCGRLIKKGTETPLAGTTKIESAICSVKDVLPASHYKPTGGKEGAKPEHRIQAALIRHALRNNLAFHDLFDGFDEIFDELIFVTDELSAGKIRADIIALGRKAENYFPVFIELKVTRALSRLVLQLKTAKEALQIAEENFIELLAAVANIRKEEIAYKNARSILVWPASPSGKESAAVIASRSQGYITAELRPDGRIVFVGT